MLGRLSLIGAMVLTLSVSLIGTNNASAATDLTSVNDTTRPSLSELQSAILRLESLGDYQTYFGPHSSATFDNQVPHYQEYLYLYNLVHSVQALINHYDDTAYLAEHQVSDQTFQDALIEMQHAYRGCSLILGLNRDSTSAKTETTVTPSTDSATQPTKAPAKTKTEFATVTNNTSTKATATASTSNNSTGVTVEVVKPDTPSEATQTPTTALEADAESTADTNDIEVPATGSLTNRQVSWPALIAVVVTAAAVASIIIAVIIRREPRRAPSARRRR